MKYLRIMALVERFKCWLIEYVPLLMRQQKWFTSDRGLNRGDIITLECSVSQ